MTSLDRVDFTTRFELFEGKFTYGREHGESSVSRVVVRTLEHTFVDQRRELIAHLADLNLGMAFGERRTLDDETPQRLPELQP